MERERQISQPFVYMMIKPLGMSVRDEIHEIIETEGIIVDKKVKIATSDEIRTHYKSSQGKKHFETITSYLAGKEVECLIVEDIKGRHTDNFTLTMRRLTGKTRPVFTEEGQIRNLAIKHSLPFLRVTPTEGNSNQWCMDNLIHCSDSVESALEEISIWFPERVEDFLNTYERVK